MSGSPGWRIADRVLTVVLVAAVVAWSALLAVLGPLFMRPVSTCAGPEYQCTGVVDLGVGVAAWGPAVVSVVLLVAIAWRAGHGRTMTPTAVIGVIAVVGLQALGQALVPLGITAR